MHRWRGPLWLVALVNPVEADDGYHEENTHAKHHLVYLGDLPQNDHDQDDQKNSNRHVNPELGWNLAKPIDN